MNLQQLTSISIRIAAAAMLLFTLPLAAHHADNAKSGQPIEWRGKIVRISWDGAHVMYRVEVENAQHVIESWEILGASPKILAMRQITPTTFRPEEVVTVEGYLNIYSKIISVRSFTKSDGQKYLMGLFPDEMGLTR